MDEEKPVYPLELVSSEDLDDDTAASIAEVSLTHGGIKIKQYDKLAALEKMGRHVGLFPANGVNIQTNVVTKIVIQSFGDDLDDLINADPTE